MEFEHLFGQSLGGSHRCVVIVHQFVCCNYPVVQPFVKTRHEAGRSLLGDPEGGPQQAIAQLSCQLVLFVESLAPHTPDHLCSVGPWFVHVRGSYTSGGKADQSGV